MIETFALAAGLAWAAGLRLYLTVFLAGLFQRLGIVDLPGSLHVLASSWVIGIAAALAIVEFCADKIPALDSLWDAVHTLIRIPSGAVIAAAALGHASPGLVLSTALAGATLAGTAHLTKAATRALINLSPAPVSNVFASATEDGLVLAGLTLAAFMPVAFLALLLAFLSVAAWVLPRLWRGVRGGWQGMATKMLPRVVGRLESEVE
ncbi:DUF4126 domain-containing protein [Chitinasiproducens palmae]|uniref:DUF4126 domain-containing protein n=1 Tax=Chitinasiproducens palmae TaxID=1770053 RepID=A0A1H2PSP3_9BURK|nr:DUF4126 domain-containing protein [Chitinasiproducens palmae]SDV50037.1 protein of unknown function [Chitinasiproducens palmae]